MRLQEQYKKKVLPEMMKKFGYKTVMSAPKIEKVILNCGFGSQIAGKGAGEREKQEEHILNSLSLMAGQKPSLRKAKKSIAGFKLREGSRIAAAVTLRGNKMYEFLEKLIFVVLPRKRDFRGIPLSSITANGDLTIGFKEYSPFPEVKVEKEKGLFGLELSVVTTAGNKEEAAELLRMMGFPLTS